jgi:DNA-binding SARP family transcriptional activator/TolB-like protein
MIQLNVLGGAALARDGKPVGGRPAQSHHLALLAFLAASPGRTATRDRLIATLWPESDSAKARHRLSVALHVLRRGLGEDCLVTSGDAVRLDSAAVESDVTCFTEAIGRGSLEDAARLYGGPFLDGFHLGGCPEFDGWAEGERERLAALYESALRRLASEAEDKGDLPGAVQWWKALTTHAPFRAAHAIGLMKAYAAMGDVAGALAHARAHVARVEGDLGIPGSAEVLELAADLTRQARERAAVASATAVVARPRQDVAVATAVSLPASSTAPPRRRRRRRLSLAALVPAAVLAAVAWAVWLRSDEAVAGQPSVAVLPFVAVEAPAVSADLGARLADEIRTTLGYVPGLRVVALDDAALAAGSSTLGAGRRLGVSRVVRGRYRVEEERLVLDAELVDVVGGEISWTRRYDRRMRDHQALVEELSLAVADDLRLTLVPYVPKVYTESERAWDRFLEGVYAHRRLTAEDLWAALQFYREGWEEDPDFALAHAIAGNAYMVLAGSGLSAQVSYETGREHVLEALALDSLLAEGYATLARLQIWWDRDWRAADRSLRRAIMLYPTHPDARTYRAFYLLYYRMDFDAAVESARLALELDPLNTARSRDVELVLYHARRYDQMPAQNRHTWSLDADVARSFGGAPLAQAYRETGRYAESVAEYEALRARTGGLPATGLALTYTRMGREEDARAILAEREARARETGTGAAGIARIYASLGEPDRAFEWLDRAFHTAPVTLIALKTDPALDPIRSDPRFGELLRRMRLVG